MPRLGQHFLISSAIAQKIVGAAELSKDDEVLEIGSGHGELTQHYIGKVAQAYLIEMDPKLYGIVKKKWGNRSDTQIIQADFRKFNLENLKFDTLAVIVSDLPYYASKPILMKILNWPNYKKSILMMQKELAQRLLAQPGDSNFGALSLFFQMKAQGEILFDVPREAFRPPPKVISSVIAFSPQKIALSHDEELRLEKIIKDAFRHRRKTLINNLLRANFPRDKIETAFKEMRIATHSRPQEMSLENFILLTRKLLV